MVPLVVIPQILFSELILPGGQLHNWTETLQKLMPVHWGYELLDAVRVGNAAWTALGAAAVLAAMVAAGWVATVFVLSRARY